MSSKSEQETVFRFDAHQDFVEIYTSRPAVAKKLGKRAKPYRTTSRAGVVSGWFFKVPFDEFRWGLRKPMSQAQRDRLRESNPGSRFALKSRANASQVAPTPTGVAPTVVTSGIAADL